MNLQNNTASNFQPYPQNQGQLQDIQNTQGRPAHYQQSHGQTNHPNPSIIPHFAPGTNPLSGSSYNSYDESYSMHVAHQRSNMAGNMAYRVDNPSVMIPLLYDYSPDQQMPHQMNSQSYNILPTPLNYPGTFNGVLNMNQLYVPQAYFLGQSNQQGQKEVHPLDRAYSKVPANPLYDAHASMSQSKDFSMNPTFKYRSESMPGRINYRKDSFVNPEFKVTQGHYKPTRTKRNIRPRINNLNENESYKAASAKRQKLTNSSNIMAELSTDDVFKHFQDILKIKKPDQSSRPAPYLIVNDELERQLLDLFVNNLSKSIDIFLPQEVFQKIVPELALYDDTNMIADSIYCLSSLIFQRIKPNVIDLTVTLKYYQRTIKSLRYHISMPGIEDNEKGIMTRCLLSTILLCIYELFFVAVDNTYVKGAAGILTSLLMKDQSSKSLLKESPFFQTCFWAMVLYDLIISIKYDLPSMYSIEKFWKPLDPNYFQIYDQYDKSESGANKQDDLDIGNLATLKVDTMWWIHKSLITFSSIVEFKYQTHVLTKEEFDNNQPLMDWLQLKRSLNDFESQMPLTIKPTIYKPSSNERLFPLIYFKDDATAIVGLNFKLAKIALYESLLQKIDMNDSAGQNELSKYPKNYPKKLAKDVVGILQAYNANLYIWPVNVHTIRLIAHYLFDEPEAFKSLQSLVDRLIVICHLR